MGRKNSNKKLDNTTKKRVDESFDYKRIKIVSDVVEELRIKESIIESSINGLAIGDLEGNLTYVNNAALELFGGYESREVLGQSAVIFAWSEDEALEALNEVREKGTWVGDIMGKKKDGSSIFVNLSGNAVKNEAGEPICIMCSFIDITERKLIEDELRIKDNAIASSLNGIGIADLEGRITYVNAAALTMWGADDPSEVLGKSPLEFAENEEEAERIFAEFIEKEGWSGEVSGRRKDGTPITILITASLVKDEKGEPICMMDSFVDITMRKLMEDELRIKDNAIASSINGIAIGTLEGIVTYANDAALTMWGADDPSEILGRPVTVFAQSEEEVLQIMQTVLEKGGWTGDISGWKKDGSSFTVQLSASLVRNEMGEPICMLASFVDITERKRMEDELRIKDNAIASSLNGIGIADLEGRITYVNAAALKMWGADDPSEVLGKSPLEFAENEEEAERIFAEFIQKGGWSGEVSGRRKDGTPITILITASLVKDEKGEPICMMDSFVDITERKLMEDELRIKDNAIASSLNGIVIGDLEGNITYVNDAFMELWGGDDISEIVGKSAVTFAEDEDEGLRIINVLQNEGNWTGEITGIRRDGIPITVQLSAGMVYNEKKEPICMMCSLVDITKRKEAEEKLQRSHEELEIRVQDRTKELTKANIKLKKEIEDRKIAENTLLKKEKELELKSLNLEEANTALKVLLRQGEKDKTELENKVLQNIKELVLPCIEKLKIYRLDDKQQAYLDILESNLNDIISPFLQKLSSKYMDFTPTEIQVANFVREGKPTKEIAELLNISERGIEFHRNNIRMKLGLKNRKTNLRTYLLSLA